MSTVNTALPLWNSVLVMIQRSRTENKQLLAIITACAFFSSPLRKSFRISKHED